MKDFSRTISLMCPTCGNKDFKSLDCDFEEIYDVPDNYRLKCNDCGAVFTKQELFEDNTDVINATIKDMEDDVMKEISKILKKGLK